MLKKYWFSVVLVFALLLSASCSTLNVGNSTPERTSAEAFELNVLEDSYFNGSSVEGYFLTTEETDSHVMVSINAYGARDLKALYFEMDYDADRYRPMGVVNTDGIADADERLSLTHIKDRGTVTSGQMVINPDWRSGFNGEGVLATVNFRKEGTPLLRQSSEVNTSAAGAALLPEWDGVDTLTWWYANPGDYNQDGLVGIADITPLGVNFGAGDGATPFDVTTSVDQVDGDNNNLITLADITPIGQNFNNSVNNGWNVYEGDQVTEYPDSNGGADKIAPLDNVAFSAAIGTNADRKMWSYTVAAPDGVSAYWVRPVSSADELGTPSEAVGGDTSALPQLEFDGPAPPSGSGTSSDPYLVTDAQIGNTFTFSVYENLGGSEITGNAGVELFTDPAGALNTVDQGTGEMTFDAAFTDTTFFVSANVDSTPLVSGERIYFRIELAPVGLYIFPDPSDTDWDGLTGDGLTEPTAFVIATDSYNTDGSVEFSFVANDQADNTGNSIDVNTLTWDAGFPFMITNGWSTPGTATFDPLFTITNVFAQDAGLNNSNDIWVAAEALPE